MKNVKDLNLKVTTFDDVEPIEAKSVNGLKIIDGTLYNGDTKFTAEDLGKLKSILNQVTVFDGIDKVISYCSDFIDRVLSNLGDENINSNIIGKVIPIDINSITQGYCTFDRSKSNAIGGIIKSELEKQFHEIKFILMDDDDFPSDADEVESMYLESFWDTDEHSPFILSGILSYIRNKYDPIEKVSNYDFYTIRDGKLVTSIRGESELKEYNSIEDLNKDLKIWNQISNDIDRNAELTDIMSLGSYTEFINEYNLFIVDFDNGNKLLKFNGHELSPKMVFNLINMVNRIKESNYKIYLELETVKTSYVSVKSKSDKYLHNMATLCNWGGQGGKTMAGVLCGACSRMVYRYLNDGDTGSNPSSPTFPQVARIWKYFNSLPILDEAKICLNANKVLNEICPGPKSDVDIEDDIKKIELNGGDDEKLYDYCHRNHPIAECDTIVEGMALICAALIKITDEDPKFMSNLPMKQLL